MCSCTQLHNVWCKSVINLFGCMKHSEGLDMYPPFIVIRNHFLHRFMLVHPSIHLSRLLSCVQLRGRRDRRVPWQLPVSPVFEKFSRIIFLWYLHACMFNNLAECCYFTVLPCFTIKKKLSKIRLLKSCYIGSHL